MSGLSQADVILKHLKRGNSLTPMDALGKFGCFRLAARIKDLRDCGYQIQTELIEDPATGKRYAKYWMQK